MAVSNYPILDADRHVSEPLTLWKDYLPQAMVIHAPYLADAGTKNIESGMGVNTQFFFHGEPLFNRLHPCTQKDAIEVNKIHGDPHHAATHPQLNLNSMDQTGIDRAALFPSIAMYCVNSEKVSPEISEAFAEAYNRWLFDYCQQDTHRLLGVGLLSRHNPDTMVASLERIVKRGWKTVVLRPEPILGRTLGHADYNAFWQACEELDVSVALHGGTHLHAPTAGSDRFNSRFALHACSHPMEAQMAFVSLLESGVLERHPRLAIAFLEAGASWVPHWLWRLDEICYATTQHELNNTLTMKPSDYFKRQCWVTIEIGEPCLREVIQWIGPQRLLYGTDFPHPDHLQFSVGDLNESTLGLSRQELKLLLDDNPRQFFRAS